MNKNDTAKGIKKLEAIMAQLRSKKGCPWDKKQTHLSLLPYLIEESYELYESVKKKNDAEMLEELGDVFLQVVFYAQIAKERGKFSLGDVIDGINEKLIRRHPHVFAGKKGVKTPAHVRAIWEKNKKEQKERESVIDGVPVYMPALLRARRLVSKAGSAGFKWSGPESVMKKVNEEMREIKEAYKSGNKKHLKEEIGDLLFVLSAYSYYNGIDPEDALNEANEKFIKRFKNIEKRLGETVNEKQMLKLWDTGKKELNKKKK